MREMWIRNRPDGVTELSPKLAPLAREDRWLLVFTVIIASIGFFVSGAMPAPMLGTVTAACLAGEVILAFKAALLVLLRPPAQVHEIPVRVSRHAR